MIKFPVIPSADVSNPAGPVIVPFLTVKGPISSIGLYPIGGFVSIIQ